MASNSVPVLVRPVSLASKILLVLAIVLGTNSPLALMITFAPSAVPLITLLWFALYTSALVGLFVTHGVNWISWLVRFRILLLILIAGSLLTLPWSVDPALSVNRFTHFFGSTILAIYLGFAIPPTVVMRFFATILMSMFLISITIVYFLPELGLELHEGTQVWKGVFDNKNTMGFWAATGVMLFTSLAALTKNHQSRPWYIGAILLSFFILYQSHSAGSLIALTFAASTMIYMHLSLQLRLGSMAMFILAGLLIVLSTVVISQLDIASVAGRSSDLTGRSEVWEQTWKLIKQRPLMGYGYGTIWSPTSDTLWIQKQYTDFTWVVYHAHNGILQIASEVGLPLTALALLFVLQQLVEIIYGHYRLGHVGALFVVGFVLAYIVSNYSEARFMQSRELYWIFFIALPISLVRQARTDSAEIAEVQPPKIIATNWNNHTYGAVQKKALDNRRKVWNYSAEPSIDEKSSAALNDSELKKKRDIKNQRRNKRNVLRLISTMPKKQD